MSFWWIWGIYFMDHVVLRNDFGMDKKLGAVSGGLGIVRVMAAAWLISVMISAVGMVLASLIFYAVGEGQNRISVSVYVVVVLAVLIGGKSFVVLTGEVAAVREAIECGIHTENAEGMEVSHVVIPNPRKEIFDSLL